MIAAILLAFALAAPQERVVDPAAELAAARGLYATAAYEDALDRLGRIAGGAGLTDQIDTYRALCLLALGRTVESERTLEQALRRNPRFTLDEIDVSPRLVVLFRGVRARMLPVTARNLYAAARASYDAQQYGEAVRQLREVLALIDVEGATDPGVSDLRILAEGFLRLAEPLAGPGASLPEARPDTEQKPVPGGPIYSVLDRDVIAPVEVSRPVPIWEAPRGTMPGLYQGLVEVVIGETGRVEAAVIRRSIAPAFDAEILAATQQWRFQPATRNGQPVRYRRSYEIIGHSRQAADAALRTIPQQWGTVPPSSDLTAVFRAKTAGPDWV